MAEMAAPRPNSLTIIVHFGFQRSTSAPAGIYTRMLGAVTAKTASPAAAAEPVSDRISIGKAIVVSLLPSMDTEEPRRNCRNSLLGEGDAGKSEICCSGSVIDTVSKYRFRR
jgi:hypothetical protein